MPNPLKDIQEQGAKEFYEKSDIRVEKGGFTYLYENRDELNLETIIDFLNQQTTIAFQAGEKEGNKVTLDMVLKEIDNKIEKGKHIGIGGLATAEIEIEVNQALYSLREKVISDNEKK